jgi:23S rRNA (adenine2503-C2)-methyltransferase
MMNDKPILFNMTPGELETFVLGLGAQKFRAKQITEWLGRGAPNFACMQNLPENLRADLDAAAYTLPVRIIKQLESSDNQTTKFLLGLADGEQIECVLMRTSYGNSVCVSSQAGCAMGCKFCASTLLGLKRNLTANEMFAQLLVAQWTLRAGRNEIRANGDPNNNDVSHIVVMGTGEPLQNTENTIGFIERANSELGIGWRRITVSTCGIVPGIRKLAEWGRPINLAISLHAPNDTMRRQIMPIANKYTIAEILDAAFAMADAHNRQLMIEYILIQSAKSNEQRANEFESNFTPECADELSELLRGRNVMVNLIPWNAVDEREFASPSGNAVHRFSDILIKNGVHTRIRRERGQDIGSACGQLRLNNKK